MEFAVSRGTCPGRHRLAENGPPCRLLSSRSHSWCYRKATIQAAPEQPSMPGQVTPFLGGSWQDLPLLHREGHRGQGLCLGTPVFLGAGKEQAILRQDARTPREASHLSQPLARSSTRTGNSRANNRSGRGPSLERTVRLGLFAQPAAPWEAGPVTCVRGVLDAHMWGHRGRPPRRSQVTAHILLGSVLWARKIWVGAATLMTSCPSLAIFRLLMVAGTMT